ncbi:MAG: ATP-binding protein [Thermoplasmatota archaeon]
MREPFIEYIQTKFNPKTLLISCGLPGTYKTETTQEIAKIHNIPILRTDIIRREILKNVDIFDEKVASNFEIRKKVYDEMFKRAESLLKNKKSVILDATFVTQELRLRAAAIAEQQQKKLTILQTHCSKQASIRRILKRTKENYESNALTEQAYLNNVKKFQEVNLKEIKDNRPTLTILHLLVDTELDPPNQWYIVEKEEQ